MKTYEKENQVYTVQEGSILEAELLAKNFEEVKAGKKSKKPKEDEVGGE